MSAGCPVEPPGELAKFTQNSIVKSSVPNAQRLLWAALRKSVKPLKLRAPATKPGVWTGGGEPKYAAGSVPTESFAIVPEVSSRVHQAIIPDGGVTQVWAEAAPEERTKPRIIQIRYIT